MIVIYKEKTDNIYINIIQKKKKRNEKIIKKNPDKGEVQDRFMISFFLSPPP